MTVEKERIGHQDFFDHRFLLNDIIPLIAKIRMAKTALQSNEDSTPKLYCMKNGIWKRTL